MKNEYHVSSFLPTVKGCSAADKGWDDERCSQFQIFLNEKSDSGWDLHSYEYRSVSLNSGCGKAGGSQLVCVFTKIQQ